MKKEIKMLLESENGYLKINEYFTLHRWNCPPEKDILGKGVENLKIEMNNRFMYSREIHSRDTQGIIDECIQYMGEMMDKYKKDIISRFKGGHLSGDVKENGIPNIYMSKERMSKLSDSNLMSLYATSFHGKDLETCGNILRERGYVIKGFGWGRPEDEDPIESLMKN